MMNGKYLYFALTAMLAVLAALLSFFPIFLLTLLYFYILYKYKCFNKGQLLTVLGAAILFLFVGEKAVIQNKTFMPKSTSALTLKFTQMPKIDGDLLQIEAFETTYHEKLIIRYQLKSELEKEQLKQQRYFQTLCRISGTLVRPKIANNPNGFDYRKYLAGKEIYWIVEVKENPLLDCSPIKPTLSSELKQLRYTGIRYLENHFPEEIASLSAALIFGDRSILDPNLLDAYQSTGIVHLLAISGLHVTLLIGMVLYLGLRCGLTREMMVNLLMLLLPVYVVLTGASPSVIRASLMIFLVLMTVKWGAFIKLMPIDALSIAFMLYLLFNPLVLLDVGFELSFSVSAAIILASQHILKDSQDYVQMMLVTSVTAQLAAFPLLLYYYFELSFMSILANMLYIPLFSFVYLPGFYLLFFIHIVFGTAPDLLFQFFVWVINLSNKLITFFAESTILSFTPGRPNVIELFIYIGLIFAIFYLWETKHYPKRKTKLLILSLIMITFQPVWNHVNPFGEVTLIDVGQGDSIFIRLPYGRGNYLIDTGGTVGFYDEEWRKRSKPFEVGRDVVVPFLKGKGITRIDKLVLTHGDMDHIGGTLSVIKELHVKQILLPSVAESSETEESIVHEAEKQKIPVIRVSSGEKWSSGDSRFYILNPERNFSGERNGSSVTIFAYIGGLSWFFGGDLDKQGEEKIITAHPNLTVDVLKAGHHGSKTSSAENFIKQIKPKIALISAGENNRFGHPHKEVVERLKAAHTKIFRTDFQGAITYRFYRSNGTFSTYLP
ncbi:DNA internalization-related competence protein ComEC/Rec2 [Neobacillus mesonae]|uniref:DNA internalization-related competence protein ComEC/Rec2 n=1 Tax=Neobacillus mesonae TaxID=1193713 RepID=UPI00203B374A|nr:DNA internalization-related competence protein ComEC/Rec2 [Neobacillus mesonae]MCM3566549.1 DNA internalization-related competence protein ComEC/Rec2 [Neobacillus mesonae]